MQSHINVGSGSDNTVNELAHLVNETVGYQGKLPLIDLSQMALQGVLMNSDRLHRTAWSPKVNIQDGLSRTYQHFLKMKL